MQSREGSRRAGIFTSIEFLEENKIFSASWCDVILHRHHHPTHLFRSFISVLERSFTTNNLSQIATASILHCVACCCWAKQNGLWIINYFYATSRESSTLGREEMFFNNRLNSAKQQKKSECDRLKKNLLQLSRWGEIKHSKEGKKHSAIHNNWYCSFWQFTCIKYNNEINMRRTLDFFSSLFPLCQAYSGRFSFFLLRLSASQFFSRERLRLRHIFTITAPPQPTWMGAKTTKLWLTFPLTNWIESLPTSLCLICIQLKRIVSSGK